MTLMVWRAPRGQMLAECTKCGSRGSTHVEVRTVDDEGRRSAMAAHHGRARDLRNAFEAELNELVRRVKSGALTKPAGAEAAKRAMAAHGENLRKILEDMPASGDGQKNVAERCPWCGAAETVVVQVLPDGVAEPREWISKPARIAS
jgi:hypothetical protein